MTIWFIFFSMCVHGQVTDNGTSSVNTPMDMDPSGNMSTTSLTTAQTLSLTTADPLNGTKSKTPAATGTEAMADITITVSKQTLPTGTVLNVSIARIPHTMDGITDQDQKRNISNVSTLPSVANVSADQKTSGVVEPTVGVEKTKPDDESAEKTNRSLSKTSVTEATVTPMMNLSKRPVGHSSVSVVTQERAFDKENGTYYTNMASSAPGNVSKPANADDPKVKRDASDSKSKSYPSWVWAIVGIASLLLLSVLILCIIDRRRRKIQKYHEAEYKEKFDRMTDEINKKIHGEDKAVDTRSLEVIAEIEGIMKQEEAANYDERSDKKYNRESGKYKVALQKRSQPLDSESETETTTSEREVAYSTPKEKTVRQSGPQTFRQDEHPDVSNHVAYTEGNVAPHSYINTNIYGQYPQPIQYPYHVPISQTQPLHHPTTYIPNLICTQNYGQNPSGNAPISLFHNQYPNTIFQSPVRNTIIQNPVQQNTPARIDNVIDDIDIIGQKYSAIPIDNTQCGSMGLSLKIDNTNYALVPQTSSNMERTQSRLGDFGDSTARCLFDLSTRNNIPFELPPAQYTYTIIEQPKREIPHREMSILTLGETMSHAPSEEYDGEVADEQFSEFIERTFEAERTIPQHRYYREVVEQQPRIDVLLPSHSCTRVATNHHFTHSRPTGSCRDIRVNRNKIQF